MSSAKPVIQEGQKSPSLDKQPTRDSHRDYAKPPESPQSRQEASSTNPHPEWYLDARLESLMKAASSTSPHLVRYFDTQLESLIDARLASLAKAGSSTNPHPEGYVDARLQSLVKAGSSTNPHPEGYFDARLESLVKAGSPVNLFSDAYIDARIESFIRAGSPVNLFSDAYIDARLESLMRAGSLTNFLPQSSVKARLTALNGRGDLEAVDSAQNPRQSANPTTGDPRAGELAKPRPGALIEHEDMQGPVSCSSVVLVHRETAGSPTSVRDLAVETLSPNVRAVLSAPHLLRRPSRDDGLDLFDASDTLGQVACISQSSRKPWFVLGWQQIRCEFLYEASSDGVVLYNCGFRPIEARGIHQDNSPNEDRLRIVRNEATRLCPGPWRLSTGDDGEKFTDILIMHRRYVVEKCAKSAAQAGIKRNIDVKTQSKPKRQRKEDDGPEDGIVLLENQTKDKMVVITSGHPAADLQPGETLFSRSPNEDCPGRNVGGGSVAGAEISSENYSLTHLRNITVQKGLSAVFRASHPTFGNMAVKVIRSLERTSAISVVDIARMWQIEERLMRGLSHPSIIKFFDSDARLSTIYMEYLPYPDLSAWRETTDVGRHQFSGNTTDATRVLVDMASALEYLMERQIFHNDIKPGNIIYDPERGAVLIDFGLASTPQDPVCNGGTPWYVPREFLTEGKRGFESDIFALGVTMLYLLRRTALPDLTGPGWLLADIKANPAESRKMNDWLGKVETIRTGIGKTCVEEVVEAMLEERPSERISATNIGQRLAKPGSANQLG